ncbi:MULTISPECIES: ATP-binding protein [Geobacillus]|uniref:Anti-sigma B factor n=1 Tax=Geobacillus thermodenitrificans (strain NG80-2) TaxID=420246 RepID=A4INE1_GEOTN|nr:ATP-binding protein [Geobacillus sp. MR]ABO66845.1 Anti-sigma B factor [Geobacillus thermodenitrificans NG80-2]ARA96808.1 ATP-binding protein [Geobacillus thermodenitrificans]OQP11058.1 ATP-binding protein [Geobacillus sp. 47C-IIb]ATO36080.1 ATP-binding protein [Geobacillus thermodenitrificans]MED0661650.1 ATP-binding protein [Geobacillus thermodenitrificans]
MVAEWVVRCKASEEAIAFCDLIAEQTACLFAVRDAELFVLAVHEAIVNAVKAVRRLGLNEGTILLFFSITDDEVTVAVEDDGDGIPKEMFKQLGRKTLSDVLLAESGRGLLLIHEIMDMTAVVERADGRRTLVMKMQRAQQRPF